MGQGTYFCAAKAAQDEEPLPRRGFNLAEPAFAERLPPFHSLPSAFPRRSAILTFAHWCLLKPMGAIRPRVPLPLRAARIHHHPRAPPRLPTLPCTAETLLAIGQQSSKEKGN